MEKELHKYCEYEKTARFFVKHPLHSYFERMNGSLANAIKNANASVFAIKNGERSYSFSELGRMIEDIQKILGN